MRHLHVHLVAVLLGAAIACDDAPLTPHRPPVATPPVWSELAGFPPDATLYALWAPEANHVIGVGPRGAIVRWDGFQWSPIDNENGQHLYAVAGSITGEVVAAGNGGTMVRFNGTRFVTVPTPTAEDLRGLWTPGGNAFIAVGGAGTILRGDGRAWSTETSSVSDALFAVWGSAPDDVFAVGLNGRILHFDGASWTPMTSGTSTFLAAVSGTGPGDVYAAGGDGTILHFDGAGWQPMPTGTSDVLQGIWAPGGPIAVGANGTVLTLDTGAWRVTPLPTSEWLYGVARAGSTTWVVGTRAIIAGDGAAWKPETRGAVPGLNGVAGPPHTTLRVVGERGYVAKLDGDVWRSEDTGDSRSFNAVWCAANGDVFAVGRNRIVRHDGASWVEEFGEPAEFFDVNGGPSGIYVVGTGGRIYRRNGPIWTLVVPTTSVVDDLHAYASLASDEAYIVGNDGRILVFNGAAWRVQSNTVGRDLLDVCGGVPGDAYRAVAVGAGGTILALNETGWTTLARPTNAALMAIVRGPGSNLYAVGEYGTVLRYDGSEWSVLPSPTLEPLRSAWSDGRALFVTGGGQAGGVTLLRYGPRSSSSQRD